MVSRKSRKSGKKKISLFRIAFILVILLMVVSVSIKWLHIGRYFASTEIPFQMEVLNGTGEDNLARKTTRRLRRMGIDILIEGNAEEFDYNQSLLIDRKGNPELMKILEKRLGCSRVLKQIQENPKVDVTFIIGRDWHDLKIRMTDYK